LAALGGFRHILANTTADHDAPSLEIVAIDLAGWGSVVSKLRERVTTALSLSKHASPAVQAANAPLATPEHFHVAFHQHDILSTAWPELGPLLQDATIITIMFTLNELYASSISLTQKFLLSLTASLREGTLLLVVDSPGSYSSVNLNGAEKKYPMRWLLDHTLLKDGGIDQDPAWVKIAGDESRWFRLADELKYPIELENMRFQFDLYRRSTGP
jgi:25S rRNA (uracil2843-N3)-methyltransferase